jgi:hypothetical protein
METVYEERPRLATCFGDLVEHVDEPLRHLSHQQVSAAEAESPHPVVEDGSAFDRPVTNTVVFHQHHPSLLPGPGQPLNIGDGLVGGNSVDLGQGVQSQPDVTQGRRQLPTAQATIKEQIGQTVRVHRPHKRQTSQPT